MVNKGPVQCCALVALLIFVILFAISFETLSPLEAGVKINSITAEISADQIYTGGRYFLGIQYGFIAYPTNLLFLEFSNAEGADAPPLKVSTQGGQVVVVELAFQCRLMTSDLVELYRKYETNYVPKFITIAETTLKNLVSKKYKTEDYFEIRPDVAKVMHIALNKALQEHFAVVESLQLKNIDAPTATDKQILDNALQEQGVKKADQIARSTLVRASTDVIRQQLEQEARVSVAEASRTAKIMIETANAEGIGIRLNATAESYKYLRDSLNYTSPEMLQYLFLDNVRSLQHPNKLAVDVQSALFTL